MSRHTSRPHETGAAMILVLGLVSIMSTAAVFSFDSLSRLIKRNLIEQEMAQARYYAMAAEQVGITQMREMITEKQNFGWIIGQGLNRYDYQLGGAEISVVAEDVSNCFNLHALVRGSNLAGYEANPDGMVLFARLLQQYGLGREAALAMSAALADWQDSDTVPMPMGAESAFYAEKDPAYRTPDAPIADISELRLVQDFTPALLAALDELVCAGGIGQDIRLNVATLAPRHAPLLAALLEGRASADNWALFLADVPLGTFASTSDLFKSELLVGQTIESGLKKPFQNYPSRIRLRIQTLYGDAKVQLVTEVRFNRNGTYAIISRKFGV